MDYCLLVITDGRADCLIETIASAAENLPEPTEALLVNDHPDEDYADFLAATFAERFTILNLRPKRGFSGAIQEAWRALESETRSPWIFHLEDDFIFNEPVDLEGMVEVLRSHPYIVQMALQRQPCNFTEMAAGGVIASRIDEYQQKRTLDHQWLEHRLFWTTNPSVYNRSMIEQGWPDPPGSEGTFGHKLFASHSRVSGFWGTFHDAPKVEHIGARESRQWVLRSTASPWSRTRRT